MAAARSDTERESTAYQLDAFHKTFNFCMQCRQYTCPNCWNEAEARCLTCAPHLGHEIMPAPFPDLPPASAYLAEPIATEAMDGQNGNGSNGWHQTNGLTHDTEPGFDFAARLAALTALPDAAPIAKPEPAAPPEPEPEPIEAVVEEAPVEVRVGRRGACGGRARAGRARARGRCARRGRARARAQPVAAAPEPVAARRRSRSPRSHRPPRPLLSSSRPPSPSPLRPSRSSNRPPRSTMAPATPRRDWPLSARRRSSPTPQRPSRQERTGLSTTRWQARRPGCSSASGRARASTPRSRRTSARRKPPSRWPRPSSQPR